MINIILFVLIFTVCYQYSIKIIEEKLTVKLSKYLALKNEKYHDELMKYYKKNKKIKINSKINPIHKLGILIERAGIKQGILMNPLSLIFIGLMFSILCYIVALKIFEARVLSFIIAMPTVFTPIVILKLIADYNDDKIEKIISTKYTETDGVITATPETYNNVIEPKKSVEFGMQIIGGGPIDTGKVKVTASDADVSVDVSNRKPTNNQQNNHNNNNNQNTGSSAAAKEVPEPTTDDWLSTNGSKIVDQDGNEVWLTGCNWFGYNTGTNCFDGLWACDLDSSITAIADHGS